MEAQTKRNIRLGGFVIIGTLLLVVAFYFIGSKQNLFGSTFRLSAKFYNVSGLVEGNNVRFAGIDVGTVEKLQIINDTTVKVSMILDKNVQGFIRRNAIASVGTDGLMGNKLVNINSSQQPSEPIKEGEELRTLRPIEMDEMTRTLNVTNNNVADISSKLSAITSRISDKNTFWTLLMDTMVAENIKSSIVNLKESSAGAKATVYNFRAVSADLKEGRSGLGKLLADTLLYRQITRTMGNLEKTGDTISQVGKNLLVITNDLKQGKGSAGQLLHDTLLMYRLNKSLVSLDSGAVNFNENMVALQHSWPLKKYFKKKKNKN